MSPVENPAHNALVAADGDGVLLRGGRAFRGSHDATVGPVGWRQFRQRRDELVRLEPHFGAVCSIEKGHAIGADDQVGIAPFLHVFNTAVLRGVGGRNCLQDSSRIGWWWHCMPRGTSDGRKNRQYQRCHPEAQRRHGLGYLAATTTSCFAAHTSATIHPITVHPRKKFNRKMASVSRLLRAIAMIEGRKYR